MNVVRRLETGPYSTEVKREVKRTLQDALLETGGMDFLDLRVFDKERSLI